MTRRDQGSCGTACTFRHLGLAPWLVSSCASLGLLWPSLIQRKAVPPTLAGLNVLGLAETGSGKTAAFALPLLHKLFEDPYGIFALIVTPSRELAAQIGDFFGVLGSAQKVRVACAIGGVDFVAQSLLLLNEHPHFVVGTPGRLAAFLETNVLESMVQCLHTLVLDEADRLLSNVISADVQRIVAVLTNVRQNDMERQIVLYSATGTRRLEAFSKEIGTIEFLCTSSTVIPESLIQEYILCPNRVKMTHLLKLLSVYNLCHGHAETMFERQPSSRTSATIWMPRSAIIFVQTCRRVGEIHALLGHIGIASFCLHSKMSQQRRIVSLEKFRQDASRILICTDVASRGIEIPDVDLVVNFDMPRDPEDYVHRVGRTSRAFNCGVAVSVVTQKDLPWLAAIESHLGIQLKKSLRSEQQHTATALLKHVAKAMALGPANQPL
mmetsp:Transcript_20641/g.63530  ORF Transcript_20641/g.63530 Transcript_20641/m.63530 type:complete len:438 (-) Transcript_20641:210-1523(-)